jgi:predicted  nucleic acid-binding Zn-ribbon protein
VGDLRRQQKRLEDEVGTLEAREAEVDKRLGQGTVAREVQALSGEREQLRSRRSHLEDEVLELMEQAEPLHAELAGVAAERRAADERAAAARTALVEAEVAVDADLARTAAERDAARAALPEALLGEYDRLRPRLGGVAVAELVNGRCSGCNLALPAVEVERLRHLAPGERATCEECGRLLVHG